MQLKKEDWLKEEKLRKIKVEEKHFHLEKSISYSTTSASGVVPSPEFEEEDPCLERAS